MNAQALRGGGGGLRQRYVTSFFLAKLLGLPSCPRVRRGFLNNLASISNNMFLCIMLRTWLFSRIRLNSLRDYLTGYGQIAHNSS